MTHPAQPSPAPADPDPHLIVVEDEEVAVEHHPEDWLAFAIFWALAIVVFVQFFSRYVMNDSAAWTEEIARYLLMWVTFVGAAVVMRRRSNIAVEVLLVFLPMPLVRLLNFLIDAITVGFVGLLAWFSIEITQRMHIQPMTVFDWPMSIVYAGVGLGCFLTFARAVQIFVGNARRGWRPDPARHGLILD